MENIADIIKLSQSLGICGKYSHIAKGKNELVLNWSGLKNKIKMLWQLQKTY